MPKPSKSAAERARKAWLELEYVGPATADDLERLGIASLADLARREPQELYDELCRHTRARQDPCVLDVFSMLCDRARGAKPSPWWEYSRKRLAEAGAKPKSRPKSRR